MLKLLQPAVEAVEELYYPAVEPEEPLQPQTTTQSTTHQAEEHQHTPTPSPSPPQQDAQHTPTATTTQTDLP